MNNIVLEQSILESRNIFIYGYGKTGKSILNFLITQYSNLHIILIDDVFKDRIDCIDILNYDDIIRRNPHHADIKYKAKKIKKVKNCILLF